MNLKKIFCWPPFLGGIGAGVTISILSYITYESILSGTNYGLWLAASFGSSVVVVFSETKNFPSDRIIPSVLVPPTSTPICIFNP